MNSTKATPYYGLFVRCGRYLESAVDGGRHRPGNGDVGGIVFTSYDAACDFVGRLADGGIEIWVVGIAYTVQPISREHGTVFAGGMIPLRRVD